MVMKRLGIVAILFFAEYVLGQGFYTTCTPLPSSPTVAMIHSFNACVANNRATAQSSGTAAANSFTLSGSTVVQPVSVGSEQADIYNQNTNINTVTPVAALTTEQLAAVSVTATSAVAALGQTMRANSEGEATYLITAESALAEGLGKLSLAGECASVSSSGCYSQKSELYATGAAYVLAQRQAQEQAGQHSLARNQACDAKNQISTDQENCGSALDTALTHFTGSVVTSVSGITVTVIPGVTSVPLSPIYYDPISGTCSPASAPGCLNLSRNATPPSAKLQQAVREILKQKYAGSKPVIVAAQNLYSTNADGSISVKGSSVYSKNDFSDVNKLKAKGLSDTFAQGLMKGLSYLMSVTTSTSDTTDSGVTSTNEMPPTGLTAAASEIKAPAIPTQADLDVERDRAPASLQIRVGSEFIGVAKDDIFKIINRRYKSEEKVDSFY